MNESNAINVRHLFATPLVVTEFSPEITAALNPRLKAMILERSGQSVSVSASNMGGWQSDSRLPEWGGEPVDQIIGCLRQLLAQITVYKKDDAFERGNIDWKVNGWANINRKGDTNVQHAHPGAYWSAVYYVSVDEAEDAGGNIQFFDPRGRLPNMYCPLLYMGIEGYMTAGHSEMHKPKAGQCIVFPSWLVHAVMPYHGDGVRISLAFNFSI